jgi:hypothetical protein
MNPLRAAVVGALGLVLAGTAAVHSAAEAQTPVQGVVVSENPSDWVPIVLDGPGIWGTATVDGITVAGGSFTSVQERGAASPVTRNNIFAFDSTGHISTTFRPTISNRVWSVIPAGDGQSVFVGGQFTSVSGVARTNRIARINVHTGQVMTTFRSPGFDGKVMDLHLANGRLYVGGYFSTVGGQPRTGLVALDPQTGADTGTVNMQFAGEFRVTSQSSIPSGNSGVGVERFTMTPDGSRLVAVGNFRTVQGQSRIQAVMLDTDGPTATLDSWATDRFSTACAASFPTYMTDIDTSPDGQYFVTSTGGAYNGGVTSGTLCDSVSRWEYGRSGGGQQPTWVDYAGGDTTTAVLVTDTSIYTGGHYRWYNNPYAGDTVGPGTVRRQGIAALDTRNGLPLSWNPSRLPFNWGVMNFTSENDGIWVGHDGDTLDGETTGRLAFMPTAGGKTLPADNTGVLPGSVYQLGKRVASTGPDPVLYRVDAGGPALPASDDSMDWAADTDATSPLRNSGSNAASWTDPIGRSASVPSTTPQAIFSTERWDPGTLPEMHWGFPVTAGLPLQVRLYFSNGYSGTSQPGQRVFDVALDGTTVLNHYDIAADVGNEVGTMKAFNITSDGMVDIDFSHVVENPLINGIEIVRTDIAPPPPGTDDVVRRTELTETAATSSAQVANGGVAWSNARGAFMVDGRLYNGWSDGTFTWRPVSGNTTFGTARTINLHGLTAFESELPGIRAMWFDRVDGRMYYTIRGQAALYYRYFTPDSLTVGAVRFTASDNGSGIAWGSVVGGFVANGKLYYSSNDGVLRSVPWNRGPVAGTIQPISGPGVDSLDWSTGALFLRVQ